MASLPRRLRAASRWPREMALLPGGWRLERRFAQKLEWIVQLTIAPHLEMQVRSGAVASRAHAADPLAPPHVLARLHAEPAHMPVPRLIARDVHDDHQPAVALLVPVGLENVAVVGSQDGRSRVGGDVEPRVP